MLEEFWCEVLGTKTNVEWEGRECGRTWTNLDQLLKGLPFPFISCIMDITMSISSIPVSHSPMLNLIHLYLIYSCIKFRKILLVLNTVESLKMDRNVH